MPKEARDAMRESKRNAARQRIAAELRWLRSAVEKMEQSAQRDYLFAEIEARGAAAHLVQIAADASTLAALRDEEER